MKRNRIISAAALLLCALFLLGACDAAPRRTDGTEASKEPPESRVNPPAEPSLTAPAIDRTFPGQRVFFCIAGDSFRNGVRSILPSEDGTLLSVDAAVERRNRQVEEALGVKIEAQEIPVLEFLYQIEPQLASGKSEWDVIAFDRFWHLDELYCGYYSDTTGFLSYFREDPGALRLDAPYWNREITKAASMGGYRYFSGDLSLDATATTGATFLNETLWERYADRISGIPEANGCSDVYELVKTGRWTMDLILRICEIVYEDLNENGAADDGDRAAVYDLPENYFSPATEYLLIGAGLDMTKPEDENGKERSVPAANVHTERNERILQKLHDLLAGPYTVRTAISDADGGKKAFSEGLSLLYFGEIEDGLRSFSDMKNKLLLPLPLLDASQYDPVSETLGYVSARKNETLFALTRPNAVREERLDVVTATLEWMAYGAYTDVLPEYLDAVTSGRYQSDRRQKELLDLIRKSTSGEFALAYNSVETAILQECRQVALKGGEKKIRQTLFSINGKAQLALEKLYKAWDQPIGIFD